MIFNAVEDVTVYKISLEHYPEEHFEFEEYLHCSGHISWDGKEGHYLHECGLIMVDAESVDTIQKYTANSYVFTLDKSHINYYKKLLLEENTRSLLLRINDLKDRLKVMTQMQKLLERDVANE